MASIFTTPPPRREPPPKHPLFTVNPLSTKSFSPGHVVGLGILVLGVVGITKILIARGKEDAARNAGLASPSWRPIDDTQLAQADNPRGSYGAK